MNIKLLTIFIFVILLLLGIVFFATKIFTGSQTPATQTPSNNSQNTFPSTVPNNSSPGVTGGQGNTAQGTMPVANANGGVMQVANFLQNSSTAADPVNRGYYYLGYHYGNAAADPAASANPPYIIEYIASTGYFNIELAQEPIGQNRLQMEQYLMNQLGISQSQMCQLSYMVSTPSSVNEIYSGQNLGFSFCAGAVQLP